MTLWTVYDRWPDPYVALKSTVEGEGERLMVSSDLIELRVRLVRLGLHCIQRNFFDNREIVEVWCDEGQKVRPIKGDQT